MTLSNEQLETVRRAIETRCAALADELRDDSARTREVTFGALAGPVTDAADAAMADVLSDMYTAELSRDLAELRALEAARTRLAQGGYGVCADCGADITFARLSVQPAALRCVDCQRRHERTFAHPEEPKL